MQKEDRLSKAVHETGGRMTEQRRAVLEALASVNTHPTAAEVYELVRAKLPDVSQGTVYRNLHKLIELGYAIELDYGSGAAHFDACVEPHHPVRCTECNQVADLEGCEQPAPDLESARRAAGDWIIVDCRIEYLGLCPTCRDRT